MQYIPRQAPAIPAAYRPRLKIPPAPKMLTTISIPAKEAKPKTEVAVLNKMVAHF